MKQKYFCIACSLRSHVFISKDDDVYSVRNKIESDHIEKSICKQGLEWVAVEAQSNRRERLRVRRKINAKLHRKAI